MCNTLFFSCSEIIGRFEDKTIIRTLTVAKATPEDLKRNYTCYARNARGETYSQAIVRMKGKVLAEHSCEMRCAQAGLLIQPWTLPCKTAGEQITCSGLFPQHTLLFMHKCIVTAYAVLLLRGREQNLRVTHSHAMVKCLGRKGRGRAVLVPSVYLGWCRPKGTGCLKWFQITLLCEGFVWCNSYLLASCRRQAARCDIAQGIRCSERNALRFYFLLWWCSSLDRTISAGLVWTDLALFKLCSEGHFFLHLFKGIFPVSQPHLWVIRTVPSPQVYEISWVRQIFLPPYQSHLEIQHLFAVGQTSTFPYEVLLCLV